MAKKKQILQVILLDLVASNLTKPAVDKFNEVTDRLSEQAFEKHLPEIKSKIQEAGAEAASTLGDFFTEISENLQPESTSKPKKKTKKQKAKKKEKATKKAYYEDLHEAYAENEARNKAAETAKKEAAKEKKARKKAETKKAKAEKKRKKQRSKNAVKNVKSAMDKKSKNDRYPKLMANLAEIESQYDSCHPAAFRIRGSEKLFQPGHHREAMIIFAHAKRERLTFDQTTDLFAEMKTEVLAKPSGKNHSALRAFLETNITPSDKHDLDRTVVFPSRSRVLY